MAFIKNKVIYNVTEFIEQITIENIDASEQRVIIDIPARVVFELYNEMIKKGMYKND